MMYKLFSIILILACTTVGYTQTTDTIFVSTSIASAKKLHATRIMGESLLFNGSDYGEYRPLKDEHPFYLSDDWILGSVHYDGQFYENVYLQYDIANDQLVIENYNFGTQVQLIKSRITEFTLEKRKFVHQHHPSLQAGFYEVLYNGATQLLARRIKRFQEHISSAAIEREFEEKNRYYMLINNEYVSVRSRKAVLKVLRAHKKELNQQYQALNIVSKRNTEQQLIALANIYDSIKK